MLNLKTSTAPWWLARVEEHLNEVLIDHAHCEKKAAGVAMNLIFAHVEHVPLVRALSEIAEEELQHFRMVLEVLQQRNIVFRRQAPSSYGARLHELVRKPDAERNVDRLLVAALIEARSCERFGLLRDRLTDRALAQFYGQLFESEARHHATYVRWACEFAPEAEVFARLADLSEAESAIIARGDPLARIHS